jgi:hypothetical protein
MAERSQHIEDEGQQADALAEHQQDDEAGGADDRHHQHDPLVAARDGEGRAAVACAHGEEPAMVDLRSRRRADGAR